jgi:transcriptional regulator with XRE-family HTH domain
VDAHHHHIGADMITEPPKGYRRPDHVTILGPYYRAVRLAKNISVNSLAERTGMSPSHICRLEKGQSTPSWSVFIRWTAGLEITNLNVEILSVDDLQIRVTEKTHHASPEQ